MCARPRRPRQHQTCRHQKGRNPVAFQGKSVRILCLARGALCQSFLQFPTEAGKCRKGQPSQTRRHGYGYISPVVCARSLLCMFRSSALLLLIAPCLWVSMTSLQAEGVASVDTPTFTCCTFSFPCCHPSGGAEVEVLWEYGTS